ncbi:hypothetical protein CR513_32990, partial [Mucuna pruriens]
MMEVKRNRNGIEGLPRSYLEKNMNYFMKEGDWKTMVDILGLLIYDIVLFPHLEDYVDLAAIDIFFAIKDKNENPILAILADTYYTLNYCQERSKKGLRCCIHLLYLWLTAHFFHGKCKMTCPIEDYKWGCIKTMTGGMRGILWKVPNVPLMATLGCFNYNPMVTLRQNEYFIIAPPMEKSTTPFIVHGRSMQDAEWFKKIRQA